MTQIAMVVYPGYTALDFIGPYEVLRHLPDAEVRFVWHEPGPIAADSGHMSKASVATTALLGKDAVKAGQLAPSAQLLCDQALRAVRTKRNHKTRSECNRQRSARPTPGFIEQNVS